VLLEDAPVALHEYLESLGLSRADLFRAVAELLRTRSDAVIVGAHAVNAYVSRARTSDDVDVLSTDGEGLAQELATQLCARFHTGFVVRSDAGGVRHRVHELRAPKERPFCDVRTVAALPPFEVHDQLQIVAPVGLVAGKTMRYAARRRQPNGGTDLADLRRLLLQFADFTTVRSSTIAEQIRAIGGSEDAVRTWEALCLDRIEPGEEDE